MPATDAIEKARKPRREKILEDPFITLVATLIYILPAALYVIGTSVSVGRVGLWQATYFSCFIVSLFVGIAAELLKNYIRPIIVGAVLIFLLSTLEFAVGYYAEPVLRQNINEGPLYLIPIGILGPNFSTFFIGYALVWGLVETVKRYKRYRQGSTDVGYLRVFIENPLLFLIFFVPYGLNIALGWVKFPAIVIVCLLAFSLIPLSLIRFFILRSRKNRLDKGERQKT